MPDLAADAQGLAALLLLLALPGLCVVRAPWPYVPMLSASFWIVSWWWMALLGGSRLRTLSSSLFVFATLAALRLLKPLRLHRPSPWTGLVVVVALARMLPYFFWITAPGIDMSLHALSTQLLVWRDGVPASYEPLLPIPTFGAYTPGLHGLAADVALLSGLPAHRAAFLLATASHGLLQVALYGLLSRLFPASVSACAAVIAYGMARNPQAFFGWGGNSTILALALFVAGCTLLLRGSGKAPAVAAGLVFGAAVVAHSMVLVAGLATVPVFVAVFASGERALRRAQLARLAIAVATSLVAVLPWLLQLDFTLSVGERAWLSDHLRSYYAGQWLSYSSFFPLAVLRYVLAGLNDAFVIAAGLGAVLCFDRWPGVTASAVVSALLSLGLIASARLGGLGPFVVFPEKAVAVLMVLATPALAALVASVWEKRVLAAVTLLVLGAIALERGVRYYAGAEAHVMLGPDDVAAMEWIAARTDASETICNNYGTAGMWVPALAGRAVSAPQVPPFHADEFAAGGKGRECRYAYHTSRFFFAETAAPRSGGSVVFERGLVKILKVERTPR